MSNATQIVHWPGNDVPACDEHASKLIGLGGFMGFSVSSTACGEEVACPNCVNESKARGTT